MRALAAMVVTFFTFLPSFIFILAGGPLVEATHGKLGFTAPLSAITAAVVGVILNLAMFFAYHVLWPQGFEGRFDLLSTVIAVAAAVALFRFKVGVMPLFAGCAVAGLAIPGYLRCCTEGFASFVFFDAELNMFMMSRRVVA